MKKLKLLFAACALMCAGQVGAQQQDVTATYLTNADFSVGNPIDNGICTYGKDMAGNSTTYYGAQEVSGWTNASVGDTDSGYDNSKLAGGLFAYGGTPFLGGSGFTAPATDPDENAGNALGLVAVWGGSIQYTQDVTLPAGSYTLRFKVYNATNADFGSGKFIASNLFGFVPNSGTAYYAPNNTFAIGQWINIAVTFNLTAETAGKISVGYKGDGGSGNMPHLFVDNVKILKNTYYQDVTSKVGVSQASWTGASDGLKGTAFKTSDGRDAQMAAFYGSSAAGEKISQTITGLAKGTYEAVVFAYSMNEWSNWSATLNNDAGDVGYVLADGKYQIKEWINARKGTHNANDYGIYTLSGIEVDDDGELKLAYVIDKGNQTEWMAIQIQSLIYTKNLDLSGLVTNYQNALAAAKVTAAKNDKMSTSLKTALNSAIDTYDTGKVDLEDADAMEAAADVLKTATDIAETSISSYATIAAGSIPNDRIEGWTNTGTGSLEVNTWSTESGPVGNNTRDSYDGTGMTVPFIQSWIWKGNNSDVYLGNGTVSYTLAGLEPGEVYYAQALVRAYSEGGNVPNGPNFFINDVVTDMTTNGTAFDFSGMKGFYGTLGGAATVGDDGKIVLGVTIQDANYNWVAFKNVSIQSMDDAFKAAVKKVTDLEGSIPTAAYQTAYAVVTDYSGENYPTDAAGFETAIAAIEAAAEAATACVEPYANATALLTSAGTLASSYPNMKTPIQQATSVLEECSNADQITNFTTNLTNALAKFNEWIELKAEAEVLATVANDNNDANTTFSGVISAQEANVQEVNSIDDTGLVIVNNAISTVKEAMATYVGAANPVGDGAQFDCTFMLTNPDLSVFSANGKQDGWYTDQNFQTQNSQVMMNNNSVANSTDKTKFAMYEYWSAASCATSDYTVYTKVALPVGTYRMDALCMTGWGYAASSPDGERNITFSAGDVDGTSITTSTLEPATLDFVQTTAGEVKIGLKAHEGNTCNWMGIGYVELYKVPAQSFTISENAVYDTTQEGAGDVTLKRTIKKDTWNTIWLPFSMTEAELKSAFGDDVQIAEYEDVADGDDSKINFNVMTTPAISPLKPVLLKTSTAGTSYTIPARTIVAGTPAIDGTNYDFVGTTAASTTIENGDYFIGNNCLWESTGNTTIAGTRAYIKAKTSNARILNFAIDGQETTAIKGIEVVGSNKGKIYNLKGQEVKNPQKGVYIQNGKTIIIK